MVDGVSKSKHLFMKLLICLLLYNLKDKGALQDLVDGTQVSDCPLPCKTTHTQTALLQKSASDASRLEISFSSTVHTKTTDMIRPTLSSFLSEVGMR